MEFEWEIIKCDNCNKVHAMPISDFYEKYSSVHSWCTCPYCAGTIGIYNARNGVMVADRGIIIEKNYILK